jgi:copper(I)-binding protein
MNNMTKKHLSALAFTLLTGLTSFGMSSFAMATELVAGDLKLTAPWIRASVPGQVNGAGYVQINNQAAQADRLISATTNGVNRVELHTIINENGVAKMREVPGIDVPASGVVKLMPGGFHIMFLGLSAPFKADTTVPVTLKFEKAGEVKVNFEIKPPTFNPGAMSGHDSHKH